MSDPATAVREPAENSVNGERAEPSGEGIPVVDPATGETISSVGFSDEGIEVTNRSAFGNAASPFTGDGAEARNFRHRTEAGNLAVNAGTAASMAFFHFGGPHAQAEDVVRFYTDETVYIER